MSAKNKPNEIYIERIYDAPVKMVWEAWVDPKKVAKWWGPRGFTLTTESKHVKTGGSWNYTMHGPDGTDYPNKTKFLEVIDYKRLVYDHGANDHQPPLFRVTVDFKEINGKTKMEMIMALETPEAAKEIKKFIKSAGGNSTWDRLGEFLSEKDIFIINRTFETSIDKMFSIWTSPSHLSKWLAPTGFEIKFIKADIREGGESFYSMSGEPNIKMHGKIRYKKITPPHTLIYTQLFVDEKENTTRHPASPTWPEEMLTTVTFTSESPNQTRITIQWEIFGDATNIEKETFHVAKPGMTQGWTGSLDKLEEYLEQQ